MTALAAGVTGTLAGCGGNDSETPTDGSSETASPMGTETESMGGDGGTATPTGAAAQVVTVGADGVLQFTPEEFTVSAGDTVRWEWDSGGHNVVPDEIPDGSDWSGTEGTGTFGQGHTYSHTFDTAGAYSYYCSPHRASGMRGSVTVTE